MIRNNKTIIWFWYFLCSSNLVFHATVGTECIEEKTREKDLGEEGDLWSDDEMNDVKEQMKFGILAKLDPLTVVMRIPGRGKGLVYVGEKSLVPDTTVALYRILLVRKDVWRSWLEDNTISLDLWNSFWMAYTVEFSGEVDDDHTWMGLPVGDLGTVDEPTWWSYGELSPHQLQQALEAIHRKILVDFRRIGKGISSKTQSLHYFNAHLINEPSSNEHEEEEENISHLTGSGCPGTLKYCGTAFEAKTSREVHPGEQLLWCYGNTYKRNYSVSETCLSDFPRDKEIS